MLAELIATSTYMGLHFLVIANLIEAVGCSEVFLQEGTFDELLTLELSHGFLEFPHVDLRK